MENKNNAQTDESKGKIGVIPEEEVKGSDADSAYNEDQEFTTPKTSEAENEQQKTLKRNTNNS